MGNIKIKINGINEATKYLNDLAENMDDHAVAGAHQAAMFLKDEIVRVTGSTKFSENLEIITDFGTRTVTLSPNAKFFDNASQEEDNTYQSRFFHCAYWKVLSKKGELGPTMDRIAQNKTYEPMLPEIVSNSMDRIKNIILNNIKQYI
jgi:hypothetical protein